MNNNIEAQLMAQEIRRYIVERRDKKELALLKEKPKKNKGGINTKLLILAESLLGKSDEQLLTIKKSKKDKTQTPLEFQQAKTQSLLSTLDEFKLDNRILDILNEYNEALITINEEHKVNIWLNQWANKACDISFATHVAKLTHSSSKASSIYEDNDSILASYLTSNTLAEKIVDTATANAASAPAGEILTLQVSDKSLLDYVKESDPSPFVPLTEYDNEIETWMNGFKQAYDSDKKQSHFLSKQVYFPDKKGKYFLLMPLVSSSLAHAFFLKFQEFFDDANTSIRAQKNNNKYHEKPAVSYPNRASLNVTASNHSNVSSLNGKRGGRLTLLTCKPPQWTAQQKAPNQLNNLFNRSLSYQLQEEIKTLQRLLLIIKSKEIAMKKPNMHRAIVRAVNDIADGLFDELNMINLLSDEKGWTKKSSLPIAQQLLLEPNRDDDIAIQEKLKKQWQANIANDFAYWLNRQLKHKKLKLTPIQQRLWQDIFSEKCRQYIAEQGGIS